MRNTWIVATCLALATVSLRAQETLPPPKSSTARELEAQAAGGPVSVEQNVAYGVANGQKLLLDVYAPPGTAAKARPGIVLIHGGGWTSFDKSTMRGMGQFLARSGFVAISVDYRLLREHENHWPAQLDDVQRSVRWLRANAAKYSVSPEHIGAFGHSAGAQLAALLGMEDTRDSSDAALAKYSSRVQAVVDASGPTDFTTEPNRDSAFLADLFGVNYKQHPEVWRDASPVFHVSKECAPFLIIHGTKDDMVPIAQSQELYDKLKQAGVAANLVTMEGEGHTVTDPQGRARLAYETLRFFERYLEPSR